MLARDRWGKKPSVLGPNVLRKRTPLLVFSSELRTFSRLPGGPPSPDPLGVARYLAYDGMPGARTVYRDVSKVPAASWVELDPEGNLRRESTYWAWHPQPEAIDPRGGGAFELSSSAR